MEGERPSRAAYYASHVAYALMAIRKRASILPKHKEPLQYASGYSLDLYCQYDNPDHDFNEFPHQFGGEAFRECKLDAIRAGWSIDVAARLATCPKCVRKLADWRRLNDHPARRLRT
jgi:hypothetical protein